MPTWSSERSITLPTKFLWLPYAWHTYPNLTRGMRRRYWMDLVRVQSLSQIRNIFVSYFEGGKRRKTRVKWDWSLQWILWDSCQRTTLRGSRHRRVAGNGVSCHQETGRRTRQQHFGGPYSSPRLHKGPEREGLSCTNLASKIVAQIGIVCWSRVDAPHKWEKRMILKLLSDQRCFSDRINLKDFELPIPESTKSWGVMTSLEAKAEYVFGRWKFVEIESLWRLVF